MPHPNAKAGSFPARDNMKRFMDVGLDIGVPGFRSFEVEDLAGQKNPRFFLYFMLSLAKELYLQYGVKPPQIVAMELEIDELKKRAEEMPEVACEIPQIEPSLDHVPYVPVEGDEIDEWIAWYCNENKVPVTATPYRLPLPPTGGQYVFAAEPPPHEVFHVRMVRGTPLCKYFFIFYFIFFVLLSPSLFLPSSLCFSNPNSPPSLPKTKPNKLIHKQIVMETSGKSFLPSSTAR